MEDYYWCVPTMVCCYCDQPADNAAMDAKIRCRGPCDEYIHINCVNMSKTTLKAFDDCKEMHFYCKLCQKYSIMGIADTLNNFSKEINTLGAALMPLSKIDFKSLTSSFINSRGHHPNVTLRSHQSPKRPRSEIEIQQPQVKEKIGTKNNDSLLAVPQPKSLVVCRLSNTTSTEKIIKYITDNVPDLPASDIKCTTLLPKDKTAEQMNHINFRVSVPERFYDQIFDASFWPKGIRVREFIVRQRTPVFL